MAAAAVAVEVGEEVDPPLPQVGAPDKALGHHNNRGSPPHAVAWDIRAPADRSSGTIQPLGTCQWVVLVAAPAPAAQDIRPTTIPVPPWESRGA